MTPPSELEDLPPTCELVWLHLALADDELAFAELQERTARPGNSIRYALNRLEKQELIDVRWDGTDGRKKHYRARTF